VTEIAEAAQGLLHLFERAASVSFLVQALFQEKPNVAVGNAHWCPQLMREHMQDVMDVHRHATSSVTHRSGEWGQDNPQCLHLVARAL
jgi:hypothetical protein